jgi:hypothetical protein
MPTFVHIADEHDAGAIRRGGLRVPRLRRPPQVHGVFALPVIPNFLVTHQWVRELKRRGFRTAVGVYFRLAKDEPVWVGRYNEPKRLTTASEAARELRQLQTLGFEVIIPRSIASQSITAIRHLPQKLGWRYFPDAHRRGIFCGCEYCMRGEIKSRGIRERYERGELLRR